MDQWHPKMHNSCSFSVTILISLWCFYTYSVLKMAANSKSVNNYLTSHCLSIVDHQWRPKMHNSCSFSVTFLISLWCFYTYSVLRIAANSKSFNNHTSRHLSTMDQWHPKMHNSCSFSVTILISLWCFYTYSVLKMAANSKSFNNLTSCHLSTMDQ